MHLAELRLAARRTCAQNTAAGVYQDAKPLALSAPQLAVTLRQSLRALGACWPYVSSDLLNIRGDRFYGGRPHGRTQRPFNDRLCVFHRAYAAPLGPRSLFVVILLPLEERLDVNWRDQPDLMDVARHLTCPVMRAGTSLHRHKARRLVHHEPGELRPRQLLAEHHRPVRCSAVQSEYIFARLTPMAVVSPMDARSLNL